jgi:hypothetical protein
MRPVISRQKAKMKKAIFTLLTMTALMAFVHSAGAIATRPGGPPVQLGPVQSVPEAGGTILLLSIGLIGLAALQRKLARK